MRKLLNFSFVALVLASLMVMPAVASAQPLPQGRDGLVSASGNWNYDPQATFRLSGMVYQQTVRGTLTYSKENAYFSGTLKALKLGPNLATFTSTGWVSVNFHMYQAVVTGQVVPAHGGLLKVAPVAILSVTMVGGASALREEGQIEGEVTILTLN